MRVLLDQGTPCSAAALLRATGIDAVHTSEIEMATAADRDILRRAQTDNRLVITLDADFHAILAQSKAVTPSVIRVRIEGLRARELVELIQEVLRLCARELEGGAVVSVQDSRIRIRQLPLA